MRNAVIPFCLSLLFWVLPLAASDPAQAGLRDTGGAVQERERLQQEAERAKEIQERSRQAKEGIRQEAERAKEIQERSRQAEEASRQAKEASRLAREISALGKRMDQEIAVLAKYQSANLATLSPEAKRELQSSVSKLDGYTKDYMDLCPQDNSCDQKYIDLLNRLVRAFSAK